MTNDPNDGVVARPLALRAEVEAFIGEVWRDVEGFLSRTAWRPTMLGKAAVKDPNLIPHIRNGRRRLTLNMALRLREFMDRHEATRAER